MGKPMVWGSHVSGNHHVCGVIERGKTSESTTYIRCDMIHRSDEMAKWQNAAAGLKDKNDARKRVPMNLQKYDHCKPKKLWGIKSSLLPILNTPEALVSYWISL